MGRLVEPFWGRALQFVTEAERIAKKPEFPLLCERNSTAFLGNQ